MADERLREEHVIRTGTPNRAISTSTTRTWAIPNDPAVLLIMGLGAQLLLWRKEFCEKLVDQGLRVIRYDNRDVGLSSKVTGRHTGAAAGAPDGPLVPRAAQPRGLHARGRGRRRRRAARSPEDRHRAHRRRLDGRHDRAGLRGPAPGAHQDTRDHLLEQQPADAAAAGAQATAGHPAEAQGRDPRGDRRERDPGHQNHRQPGLSGARGPHPRRGASRATTGPTTPRASAAISPRSSAPAACCATTGRSTSRPW